MTDYDDTNSGALFKNDKKETDKHPDYRGTLNVNGAQFWVSSWIKTSKAGQKYMSLSVTAKEGASAPARAAIKPAQSAADEFFDEDIPF